MWVPTEDEAVEMFARHFEALHRSGAIRKAEQRASHFKSAGDHEGHRVWQKVAGRIVELRHPERIKRRRSHEAGWPSSQHS